MNRRLMLKAGLKAAATSRRTALILLVFTALLNNLSLAQAASSATISALGKSAVPTPRPSPARKAAALASKVPSVIGTATAKPKATPTPLPKVPDAQAVVSFISQVVAWYRNRDIERHLVNDPAESLFLADNNQLSAQIVRICFQYARAQATLLEKINAKRDGAPVPGETGREAAIAGSFSDLQNKLSEASGQMERAKAQVDNLRARVRAAVGKNRTLLEAQLVTAKSELELAQSRVDSFKSIIEFEGDSAKTQQAATGLLGQIENLERSIPEISPSFNANGEAGKLEGYTAKALQKQQNAVSYSTPPSGLIGLARGLLLLQGKATTLDQWSDSATALTRRAKDLLEPLVAKLGAINQDAQAIAAQAGTGDIDAIRRRQAVTRTLIEDHKLYAAAALPLNKSIVLLQNYAADLDRWRTYIRQRSGEEFHGLMMHLLVLAALLSALFLIAYIWRRLIFQYVDDVSRRRHLLQVRRIALVFLVGAVLLINFANQMGTVATILGFTAAGIAFALQNVILAIAAYFLMHGRYGIRVGDRIQIGGVVGDVVDIGLTRMSILELVGTDNNEQPTGRVVVFPNSVLFQSSGNFFKQAPGTSFLWNEVRFTLAPECDYRLAEKRLLDTVDEVYARYRETVRRECMEMERHLNLRVDTPKPRSFMRVGESGIEMVIRYPAEIRNAARIADEVSRRLIDTIAREPGLRMVTPGTPSIQTVEPPPETEPPNETEASPKAKDVSNGQDKPQAVARPSSSDQ